jgi:hypothetical protein
MELTGKITLQACDEPFIESLKAMVEKFLPLGLIRKGISLPVDPWIDQFVGIALFPPARTPR